MAQRGGGQRRSRVPHPAVRRGADGDGAMAAVGLSRTNKLRPTAALRVPQILPVPSRPTPFPPVSPHPLPSHPHPAPFHPHPIPIPFPSMGFCPPSHTHLWGSAPHPMIPFPSMGFHPRPHTHLWGCAPFSPPALLWEADEAEVADELRRLRRHCAAHHHLQPEAAPAAPRTLPGGYPTDPIWGAGMGPVAPQPPYGVMGWVPWSHCQPLASDANHWVLMPTIGF